MTEYDKIQTIWKRDERGNIIEGAWSLPELEYLRDCEWEFTEKVDGTNIRVIWDGERVRFGGKTDNAQIPTPLLDWLMPRFTEETCGALFTGPVTLYGEGFGGKIQSGGNYGSVRFALFDAKVGDWWLQRETLEEFAAGFGIPIVPVIGHGTLGEMWSTVAAGMDSEFAAVVGFKAEGIVARTTVGLQSRKGERLICKLKRRDFK